MEVVDAVSEGRRIKMEDSNNLRFRVIANRTPWLYGVLCTRVHSCTRKWQKERTDYTGREELK